MKLRNSKEMQADPNFLFMVGRMVGCSESAAILLQAGGEMHALHKLQGRRLNEVAGWFLDKQPEEVGDDTRGLWMSEDETKVK